MSDTNVVRDVLGTYERALEEADHCFVAYAPNDEKETRVGGAPKCVGFIFVARGESMLLPCSRGGDFYNTIVARPRLGFSVPLVISEVLGGATIYGAGHPEIVEDDNVTQKVLEDLKHKYKWFNEHFMGPPVALTPDYLVLSGVEGEVVRVTRLAKERGGDWSVVDVYWKGLSDTQSTV